MERGFLTRIVELQWGFFWGLMIYITCIMHFYPCVCLRMDLADPRAQHYTIWCNPSDEVPTSLTTWKPHHWLCGSQEVADYLHDWKHQLLLFSCSAFISICARWIHSFHLPALHTGSTAVKKPLWLQFFKQSLEGVLHQNQMVFWSPVIGQRTED